MTQLELARNNKVSPQIKKIAKFEHIKAAKICKKMSEGTVVIPLNIKRRHKDIKICGIGEGLRTKVNVNIGTSTDKKELKDELKKLNVAIEYGADTVMDLSIGGNLRHIRKTILENCSIPLGTVPIYEVAVNIETKRGSFLKMTFDDMLEVLNQQAEDGVDFFTIQSGVTQEGLKILKQKKRILDIVSRGGAILTRWMSYHNKENPLYENFDEVLSIAKKYDVTLSLGDGMRPGSILDATDKLQLQELRVLGKLAKRALDYGVQVIVEGPGHVPLNQIEENIKLEKNICHNAPFYVLGPLVTDIASGYDHISAAIGATLAASYGADFLCYVTASEHLRHPSIEDVKDGLIASRIAAHAADLAKGIRTALEWDKNMSLARKTRNWEKQIALSIDPVKARLYRSSSKPHILDVCTMCSRYCSIKLIEKCLATA